MCLLPTLLQPGVGESVWECLTNSPIVECGGILSFVWVRAQLRQSNSEGQKVFWFIPACLPVGFGNHTFVIPCEDAPNQKPTSSCNCTFRCMYVYICCFFYPCHVMSTKLFGEKKLHRGLCPVFSVYNAMQPLSLFRRQEEIVTDRKGVTSIQMFERNHVLFIVWSFAPFVVSHRIDHFLQMLPPNIPPSLLGIAASFIFSILRMLRLVRVMRLLRLLRKSRALRELQKSLGDISMGDYVTG